MSTKGTTSPVGVASERPHKGADKRGRKTPRASCLDQVEPQGLASSRPNRQFSGPATRLELDHFVKCPCPYYLVRWEDPVAGVRWLLGWLLAIPGGRRRRRQAAPPLAFFALAGVLLLVQ